MFDFLNDWRSAENKIFNEQASKLEKEEKNQKRLDFLNKKYEFLEKVFNGLSEAQKAKLDKVPRTKEEWKQFNKAGKDLDKYERDMDKLFVEISLVVADLPLNDIELEEEWQAAEMEVMKKYHLNN